MNELYQTTTRLEEDNPPDSVLHVVLREHLAAHHPRVLFVGYGDTDLWQHLGRYDAFLETAHSFDRFVQELWEQTQSMPQYRNQTTFIITTDHGRGSGPVNWKDHGVMQPGSGDIWIAVMGPDTAPLGERKSVPDITQSQIAATVAAFVGEDFGAYKPTAAKSMIEAMGPRAQ
jgi:phosphopentomutase